MGKKPNFHNHSSLSHAQCREKVCLICFEVKKSSRIIKENQQNYIDRLKAVVGANFDITDQRIPTGLCDSCRKEYFTYASIAADKRFNIPQYLQFVVVPENIHEKCDCSICQKLRPQGKKVGLYQPKDGRVGNSGAGRPKKQLGSPLMKHRNGQKIVQ